MNTPSELYDAVRTIQDSLLEMSSTVAMDNTSDPTAAIDQAWNHLEDARQILAHLQTKD